MGKFKIVTEPISEVTIVLTESRETDVTGEVKSYVKLYYSGLLLFKYQKKYINNIFEFVN